jgi:hypothetical protein
VEKEPELDALFDPEMFSNYCNHRLFDFEND